MAQQKTVGLRADLVANPDGFEAGLRKADTLMQRSKNLWSQNLRDTDKGFSSLSGTVGKLTSAYTLLAGVVTGVAGSGLVLFGVRAVKAAGDLKDMADRLTISTTELQKYQFAAKQSGVGTEKLEVALTKLNSKIAEGELKYDSTAQAIDSIAEAVKNAKDDTERLAIVNDAFGAKLGAKLLPFLKDGAEGVRLLGEEAERTGNVMSESTIKATDEFGDKVQVLFDTIDKNMQAGYLESFISQSGDVSAIYSDPQFVDGVKSIGTLIGDISVAALKAGGALGQMYEQGKWLFDEGIKLNMKIAGIPEAAKRQSIGKGDFGTDLESMYSAPWQQGWQGPKATPEKTGSAGRGTGIVPYVSSTEIKAQEKATEDLIKAGAKRADQAQQILDSVRQESEQLAIQTEMFGQKESAISRAQRAQQIANQLQQQGIKLSAQQKEQLDQYLDSLEYQTELYETQQKQQKALEETERNRQQAIDQLGASFESAFEKAIVDGEKLGDVLNSLLDDIVKLLTRLTITEPLINGITDAFKSSGSSSGGGGIGGFFSDLFGSLPSFAVGTDYVPQDMVAKIHKGERIIPAGEAARMGGGNMNVIVQNMNGSQVSSKKQQNASGGMDMILMIQNAVADGIGTPGNPVNNALKGYAGRSIIRR